MNKEYDKNIGIEDECFESLRINADAVLQKLIGNMVEKGSKTGSMTIKIEVGFATEFINDYDEYGYPDGGHDALKPVFTHKISSVMKIEDKADGSNYSELMELHYDDDSGKYILIPIKGGQQMNLFESQEYSQEDEENDDCVETVASEPDVEPVETLGEDDFLEDNESNDFAAFDDRFANNFNPPEEYQYDEPKAFLNEDEQQ